MKHRTYIFIFSAYTLFMVFWFFTRSGVKENSLKKPAPKPESAARPLALQRLTIVPLGTAKVQSASESPRGSRTSTTPPVLTESHITLQDLPAFKPYTYPSQPFYDGEPVTAYVRVPSTGKELAMTVNQGGEYPRLSTQQGEQVQVRLAFTSTEPGATVAFVAQDGGKIEGDNRSLAGVLDAARQIAFAFTVSPNPGLHRVTIESPAGETKTLEFWAGPPMPMKKLN